MASPYFASPSEPPAPVPTAAATPQKHPGERLADFFNNFFKTITAISTLGASLTFSKTVSSPVEPWRHYGFTATELQFYIADAFVCFAVTLFITTLAASALSMWRPQAIVYFGTTDSHKRRIVLWWASLVSFVLVGLEITAFIFMGLVIAGLTGPAGWVALGFTVFFGIIVMAVIVWQSPIGSPPPILQHKGKGNRYQPTRFGSYHSSQGQEPEDQFVVGESGEKLDVFDDERVQEYRREEEGYICDEEAERRTRYVDGAGYRDARAYVDEPLGRSSTIARPTIAAIPPYTEDLRRMRHIRASEEYDGRYVN